MEYNLKENLEKNAILSSALFIFVEIQISDEASDGLPNLKVLLIYGSKQ
jgi:hypothetical protein